MQHVPNFVENSECRHCKSGVTQNWPVLSLVACSSQLPPLGAEGSSVRR